MNEALTGDRHFEQAGFIALLKWRARLNRQVNTALTCELRSRGQARPTRFHPASPANLCIEVRRPALRRYAPAHPLANVPPPGPKPPAYL